jgi:hypothetical protein
VVAIEKTNDDTKPAAVASAVPAVAPAVDASGPVVAPAASAPIEDMITTEDIIIEIDGD